jgi:hypothetical protein
VVCVEKINVQGTTDDVLQLMLQSLDSFASVNVKDLGSKFISMGCDNSSVFGGAKVGVTT